MPSFFASARLTGMLAAELRVKNAVMPIPRGSAARWVRVAARDDEHEQRIDEQRHHQHRGHEQPGEARVTRQRPRPTVATVVHTRPKIPTGAKRIT